MSNPEKPNSSHLTRRGLLSAGSAVAVASLMYWPERLAAAELDLDAFLKLSRRLTGRDELDDEIASNMLAAFDKAGKTEALAALAGGEDNPALANAVLATWYTGGSPDPGSATVVSYTDALIWEAMDYTKPMAVCGGQMGYWAEAPAA